MNVLVNEFNATHPGQVDFVAIPTNNFRLQEPGANDEIVNGLRHVRPGGGFEALYKIAEKNNANGANADPLFIWLKNACEGPQRIIGDPDSFYFTPIAQDDISWNFEKFLIDQNGKPYKRYTPDEEPLTEMRTDMLELLNNGAPSEVQEPVGQPEPVVKQTKPARKPAPRSNNKAQKKKPVARRPNKLRLENLKKRNNIHG